MRSTPTPPPQRQGPSYEPSYLAQQGQPQQGGVTLRAAYESGFIIPPGYDATQAPAAPQRAQPSYDRALYENAASAAPYDQPYGTKASRRESAVFMGGGLNHQSSRSRLGQETRF
jgi:RalA-binding protein 1